MVRVNSVSLHNLIVWELTALRVHNGAIMTFLISKLLRKTSSEDNWPQVCEAVTKGEKMSSMLKTDEGKVPVIRAETRQCGAPPKSSFGAP